MKHPTSRMLHAYWDELRGARAAPDRGEIEPGAIRHILADSLMLEVEPSRRSAAIRLAGTRVCALFGRELKGSDLRQLWDVANHADPWRLVEIVIEETDGIVAGLQGWTADGEGIDLELLLLPLRHRGRTQDRVLGALSPSIVPAWLGMKPVQDLETRSLRVLAREKPAFAPAPANDAAPQVRGRFVVHRGGRA